MQIGTVYTTSDGRQWPTRAQANKHQMRLCAISDFADDLTSLFGLEREVAVNTAAYLADRPEKLMALIGKTLRKKDDAEPGANTSGDGPAEADQPD